MTRLHFHSLRRVWASVDARCHAMTSWLGKHLHRKSKHCIQRSSNQLPQRRPATEIHIHDGSNIVATSDVQIHLHFHIELPECPRLTARTTGRLISAKGKKRLKK